MRCLSVDKSILEMLPESICRKNKIFPFNIKKDDLYVFYGEDLNEDILEQLKFLTKKNIKLFKEKEELISKYINTYYNKLFLQHNDSTYNKCKNKKEEVKAPTVKFTSYIVEEAVGKNASDIHIEPFKDFALIRFRIDGRLTKFLNIPLNIYNFVCTRIKIISGMDISCKNIPQDGKIHNGFKKPIDFRVSTIPTIFGEKVVVRILYKNNKIMSFEDLGFLKKDIDYLNSLLKVDNGLILITGSTGSGKTTTLYSILNNLDRESKNIVTIEDPVEYVLEGINQINVDKKRNLTFLEGIRSILRQDPDIIMLGEIRDEETAKVALRAGITGHLVFSTLHTNSALESIVRLEDMKIPKYIIKDAIKIIISQRLVRKICPYCKVEYTPNLEELNFLSFRQDSKLYKGKGCINCSYTGYLGRTIIYEILSLKNERVNNKKLKDMYYIQGNTIVDNAILKINKGITTIEEIKRVI